MRSLILELRGSFPGSAVGFSIEDDSCRASLRIFSVAHCYDFMVESLLLHLGDNQHLAWSVEIHLCLLLLSLFLFLTLCLGGRDIPHIFTQMLMYKEYFSYFH